MSGDQAPRELNSLPKTGVQVGVVEEHRAERAELAGAAPPLDLVVVELGQLAREARRLRVLVDLGLPAVGDRHRQPGAGDLGNRAV